jgi:hypothetical protein
MLTALQLIKNELKDAREGFAGTVADIQEDHLHKDPGGKALPLGATYAHLVFSEDAIMQGMIQQKHTLYETTWKGKTGVSETMPAMDENWSANNEKWARSVKIDLKQLREYEKAVYAATDEYINNLKDEDLEKEVDLGAWGKKTVAELLSSFIIGHTYSLMGEISALKGIQGAKGYAF